MADFLSLPVELQHEIIKLLPRSQDVAAAAGTCRQLNRVASERLYQHIKLRPDGLDDLRHGTEIIIRLAASLFRGDPALRNSTKTINITLPDTDTFYWPHLVPSDIRRLSEFDNGAFEGERKRLHWGIESVNQRRNLKAGQLWAYITLLLHACRGVQSVTLDGNFFGVLEFWNTDLAHFTRLEKIQLITSDIGNIPRSKPPAAILDGLALVPKLRELHLTVSGGWSYNFNGRTRPESLPFPYLTVLVLWKCELKMRTIRTVLCHMPALSTLEIHLLFAVGFRTHDFDLQWCMVDLNRLRKAILGKGVGPGLRRFRNQGQHCSVKLENLKISLDFCLKTFSTSALWMDLDERVLPENGEPNEWDSDDSDDSDGGEDENGPDAYDDEDDDLSLESEDDTYGRLYNHEDTDAPDYKPRTRCTHWEIYRMGSLKKLHKLKTLEIDPMLLYGNRRSEPLRLDEDLVPRYNSRWASLDTLLPGSLQELRINNGNVGWYLYSDEERITPRPGAGADMDALIEMFKAYKETHGRMPKLKKLVHLVDNPFCNPIWNQQQEELVGLLRDVGIQYDYPY